MSGAANTGAPRQPRPGAVAGLAGFFAFGTTMSAVATLALLLPGGPLEPIWRLNPRAREGFAGMGIGAPLLLAVVSAACASAGVGLWRGRRWGWWIGMALLAVSAAGDLLNALFGIEPRAWVGVPVAVLLAWLLARPAARAWCGIARG